MKPKIISSLSPHFFVAEKENIQNGRVKSYIIVAAAQCFYFAQY